MMTEEEFRIRLNKKSNTKIFDIPIRQCTLDEILDDIGYDKFKHTREFVNLNIDSFNDEISKNIEEYMYDVKEKLMLDYQGVGYDMIFDLYDMVLYVPFIMEMFIDFLKMFTYCKEIYVKHIPAIDEMLIIYYIEEESFKVTLTRKSFEEFMDMFSILNFTVRVDRSRVKDSDSVKEFDRQAKEIKEKYGVKGRQDITLESITSALIDSDNPNYTHESIGSKTIYQIMNSFGRMCKMRDNDFMNLIRVNATKIKEEDIKSSMWYCNLY